MTNFPHCFIFKVAFSADVYEQLHSGKAGFRVVLSFRYFAGKVVMELPWATSVSYVFRVNTVQPRVK